MTGEERAIWDHLLAAEPVADVKASPLGLAMLPREPRLVIARHAGAPVALAVLDEDHLPWRRLHARRLASAGDDHWRFGPLVTAGDAPTAIDALLDTLEDADDWDVLALGPMLPGPVLAALIAQTEARQMRPRVTAATPAPRVVFEGTWDAYFAQRSSNLRSTVRRCERHLQELGQLVLEEHRDGSGLDQFFAIEASGWKGTSGTAIAVAPGLRDRYARLATQAAATGQLRLYLLRAGTTIVAGDLAILHDRALFMLKTGYADPLAKLSPGQVLHMRVLERLWTSDDVRSYDFMPGEEHARYKRQWANDVRAYATVRLFHPRRMRGQLLAAFAGLRSASV